MVSDTGYEALKVPFSSGLVLALEDCAASIARLDGRVSISPIARPWRRRAAYSGYARALQLQGVEIDEIDVLSWGCGLSIPQRPRRASNLEEFDGFPRWWESLLTGDSGQWRDQLPFTPVLANELPIILRAIDLARQYAWRVGSEHAWLALPRFLHRLGLTESPLPCLVGGAKALRGRSQPSGDLIRGIVRFLASAAVKALDTLDAMEMAYRASGRALLDQHRPGALVRLFALSLSAPVLSPKSAADALSLTLSGSGKLLERAAEVGMLIEVTGRKAWKTFLTPDLAIAFGFRAAGASRTRKLPTLLPGDRALADVFDAFDQEIAAIDATLGRYVRAAGGPQR